MPGQTTPRQSRVMSTVMTRLVLVLTTVVRETNGAPARSMSETRTRASSVASNANVATCCPRRNISEPETVVMRVIADSVLPAMPVRSSVRTATKSLAGRKSVRRSTVSSRPSPEHPGPTTAVATATAIAAPRPADRVAGRYTPRG